MVIRDKLKVEEDMRQLRKELEASLPDDKRYLAVEMTNLSMDYMSIIKSLENKNRK